MTDQEINVAIAEACGWKSDGFDHWKNPRRNCHEDIDELPDYCRDLNAMHEAEMSLTDEQLDVYYSFFNYKGGISAIARQRAEAFLRVKGLWR